MKKLIFILCLSFSFHLAFSQVNNMRDSIRKGSSVNIIKDNRIDQLNETYVSSYKLMGYRVQIYSGNKKQPANQARITFTQLYKSEKAHELYEQPYFKVRVGDFRTKVEALKFKNELIKHFPNCFIVRDEIDFKEITD